MIRVLFVHHEQLVRAALIGLLHRDSELSTTGIPWQDATRVARTLRPHVCIADADGAGPADPVTIAELSGLRTSSGGALLVLCSAHRPGALHRAVKACALGFVDKDSSPAALQHAVHQVAAGQRYVDPTLSFGFLLAARNPYTERELSVLSLAAHGASNLEIAEELHLAPGTVRNYFIAITRKTGARHRMDAIHYSQTAGWV
ncbi:response regulator transcription factor [Streptomyces albicerus]|uniref:response regulator transcription factor n=1 Tax=Streptomyces albicerus TaxID=2569859 RepID=UPI001788D807|nr:response regulator transcription factor [Streptomyces albicerus]